MPVESAADRLVFFNTDEFGVVATKGSDTFNGIFNNDYDEELEVQGSSAEFVCRSEDIASFSVVRGDTLTLSGNTFIVREVEDDGTGITTLNLEKQ